MKKHFYLLIAVFIANLVSAQIPAGYYNGTDGLTSFTLKTKLHEIIKTGHQDKGYNWVVYATSDRDKYYENDNSVLDIYSEKPNGADPYNFTIGTNQCGNYTGEASCYNREHSIPKSTFNDATPMHNDYHHLFPTDGYVNGRRGNWPYGEVANATWTSQNGSKLGSSALSGYSGTVFEPIDEFKGDLARVYFYFATRYQDRITSFNYDMYDGTTTKVFAEPFLSMLLKWHRNDPVSQKELDRNNAVYNYQKNRNPYVDNPNWVEVIWGNGGAADTQSPSTPTNLAAGTTTSSSVPLSWTASTDNVAVTSYDVYMNGVLKTNSTSTSTTISGLTPVTTYSFYVIAKDAAGNVSPQSNTVTATTLSGPVDPEPTTTCGTETFETIPAAASAYESYSWTNNGITWNTTDSRTDQTLNGKGILVRNGALTSSSISGGIASLTVKTKRVFGGTSGTFNLKINGTTVATIPYGAQDLVVTTTIPAINITGNIIISIAENSTAGNRVVFDDLSWTCYAGLATSEAKTKAISISPNPVKNGEINVSGTDIQKIKTVQIISMSGKLIKTINQPFKNSSKIVLGNTLPKGVYILKADDTVSKFIVE